MSDKLVERSGRWNFFNGSGLVLSIFGLLLFCPLAGQSYAAQFRLGNDVRIDWDNTLSYGVSFRTQKANSDLLSDPNADDGNRSFNRGDDVSNQLKLFSEADLQYKNFGLFVRGRAFYDFAYRGDNQHDSPATHNNAALYGGELNDTQKFTDKIKDEYEAKAELLDLFAYGKSKVGGHTLAFRVGRQVVSWGESLFLSNGVSTAQAPLDGREANKPGVELKDIFLPVGQVSGQVGLMNNLTLAGYYKWEWERTRLDEGGTFYSTSDILDKNGHNYLVAPGVPITIDRAADDEASDTGEWGLALRYMAGWLNDTEFGIYYLNYHDTLPQLIVQTGVGGIGGVDWGDPMLNLLDASSYKLAFQEDIKLYGFSAGGVIGDVNVGAEVSYRTNFAVPVVDSASLLGFGYEDGNALQAQVSATYLFGPGLLWDDLTFLGEAGWNRVGGVDAELYKDTTAWGYTARFQPTYLNVMSGLDLYVPITYKQGVNGDSSVQGTFTEGANSLSVGFNFVYAQIWKCDVSYVAQLGSPEDNAKTDRDTIGIVFKRTF